MTRRFWPRCSRYARGKTVNSQTNQPVSTNTNNNRMKRNNRNIEESPSHRAGLRLICDAAKLAGNAAVEDLAETLKVHAQNEEEIFYPAALLVGELVRARSATGTNQP